MRSRAKWTEFGQKDTKIWRKDTLTKRLFFSCRKVPKYLNVQKDVMNELKLLFSTLYTRSKDNENGKRDINNFF